MKKAFILLAIGYSMILTGAAIAGGLHAFGLSLLGLGVFTIIVASIVAENNSVV